MLEGMFEDKPRSLEEKAAMAAEMAGLFEPRSVFPGLPAPPTPPTAAQTGVPGVPEAPLTAEQAQALSARFERKLFAR